jgi:hypothetical protein
MMTHKDDETTFAAEGRLLDHLAREEAKRRAPVLGASSLEAVLARISAEVTRAASERKAAQTRRDR